MPSNLRLVQSLTLSTVCGVGKVFTRSGQDLLWVAAYFQRLDTERLRFTPAQQAWHKLKSLDLVTLPSYSQGTNVG